MARYFKCYRHFINTIFCILREHVADYDIEYIEADFATHEQLRIIFSKLNPSQYTWELIQDPDLIYTKEIEEWMTEEFKFDKIKRHKKQYFDAEKEDTKTIKAIEGMNNE